MISAIIEPEEDLDEWEWRKGLLEMVTSEQNFENDLELWRGEGGGE